MSHPQDKPLLKVSDLRDALSEVPGDADLSVDVLVNEFAPEEDGELDSGRRSVFPFFRVGYSVNLTTGNLKNPPKHATLTFDMRPNLTECVISREQLDELRGRG